MKIYYIPIFFLIFFSQNNFAENTITIELKKVGLKITVPKNFVRVQSDQVQSYKNEIGHLNNICEGTKQGLDKAIANPNFEILLNTLDYNETITVVKFPKFDIDKSLIDKLQDKIKENCLSNATQAKIEFLNSVEGKIPIGNYFSTLAKVQSEDMNYFSENFFISTLNATYLVASNSSKAISNYELIHSIAELDIEEKDSFLDQYKRFYQKKNYQQCIFILDEAIKTNPNKPQYYLLRAILLNQSKNYNIALQDANKCLDFDKSNIDALVIRGLIKSGMKRYDESIEDIKKAELTYSILTLAKTSFESTYGLSYMYSINAINYNAKQDYNSALVSITEAINLDPSDPDNYYFRASIYSIKEEFKKAIFDFSKAIDLGYKNIGKAYFMRSLSYFSNNNNIKGCEDLAKAENFGFRDSKINLLKQYCK